MHPSLRRFTIALIFVTTIISLNCTQAKAQSDVFTYLFHGGTYNSEAERQALYTSNAELPLGGLLAAGFTRTMTFLGGVNFPSQGVEDSFDQDFSSLVPAASSFLSPSSRNLDDSGYALSFAFGRRHSRTLRSEIEVAFRSNEINQLFPFSVDNIGSSDSEESDGSINATSLLKNFVIEFDNNSLFTPYAGAGLGLSYIDLEFGEATGVDGEPTFQAGQGFFTYQAIGGIATKLNSFSDFLVEYRFLGTSELEFGPSNDAFSYNTSTLFFGAMFEY